MKFAIRDLRTNKAGFNQLARLHALSKTLFLETVEIDFGGCSWFDANMSAPLGVILTRITDEINDVTVNNLPPSILNILSKNKFLQQFKFGQISDTYGTVVPYQRFNLNEIRFFAAYVQEFTQGKGIPAMTPELRRRFHEGIGELFANAVTHSESRLGAFSCGQYFPKKKRFDFCIADAGSGFQGAIERVFELHVDSLKAMRFCLTKGNTTKQNEPGGLGLKLLKNFIALNEGRIVIVSNQAYYEFSKDLEDFQLLDDAFPGTCVNIEINTADSKNYRLSSEPLKHP